MPQTRTAFWYEKFAATTERVRRQIAELMSMGWKVVIIWECEVKKTDAVTGRLRGALNLHCDQDCNEEF
jgi:DNA mismatch endonuclease (patch repair protein)